MQVLGEPLLRGRFFNDADNETAPNVAIVNEAFVKRFFKSGEEPLDHKFGLDLPENANTFRIVGIVKDAKFAGWGLNRPARPMFYAPLAQYVKYSDVQMQRLELASHTVGGALLITNATPGALESQLRC